MPYSCALKHHGNMRSRCAMPELANALLTGVSLWSGLWRPALMHWRSSTGFAEAELSACTLKHALEAKSPLPYALKHLLR